MWKQGAADHTLRVYLLHCLNVNIREGTRSREKYFFARY
jgi:hypothetical protein